MSKASGYVRHFVACNQYNAERFVPFLIDGAHYGWVTTELATHLLSETKDFVPQNEGLTLLPSLQTFAQRSQALLRATELISKRMSKPLRREMYAVVQKWGDESVAQIDRVAVPWFGVRAWGVHINGFVQKKGGVYVWVGKRAANRPAEPHKFDNLVGGGQPYGLSVEENLCKESKEEAGIEPGMALRAKFARTLDYQVERPDGMRRDSLFIYDLELPESFEPRNTDGEVAAFYLMSIPEIVNLVRNTDKFKFNCNLVVIDFLMRHGFISESESEYDDLRRWLKVPLVA